MSPITMITIVCMVLLVVVGDSKFEARSGGELEL